MILRIWHGYTTRDKAAAYEQLLKEEVFTGIKDKNITGYRGIELIKRELDEEIEFITIMTFDSIDSIKQFTGEDYEQAYVPEAVRKLLWRFDTRSQHYEVIHQLKYAS